MQDRTNFDIEKMIGDGGDRVPLHSAISEDVAFGYRRDFLQNQFVYLVISPQAKGLSIGINLNPLVNCSLQSLSCETGRIQSPHTSQLDVGRMGAELDQTLRMVDAGWL